MDDLLANSGNQQTRESTQTAVPNHNQAPVRCLFEDCARRLAIYALNVSEVSTCRSPSLGSEKKTGRPTKVSAERQERILDALRAGNYVETAALAAGVGKSTFYEWCARFPDFAEAVESARAEAEARNVAVIQDAAVKSWQAAAWGLERSAPNRWGRRERASANPIDRPVGPAAPAAPRKRTAERFADLLEIAREAGLLDGTSTESPASGGVRRPTAAEDNSARLRS